MFAGLRSSASETDSELSHADSELSRADSSLSDSDGYANRQQHQHEETAEYRI